MEKKFEIRQVHDTPRYGRGKSAAKLPLLAGTISLLTSCIVLPLAGVPAVEMARKEIRTVNVLSAPIPGLSLRLSRPGDPDSWEAGTTGSNGTAVIAAQLQALPLDLTIQDVDGEANGSYADKTISFDDEDPETVVME